MDEDTSTTKEVDLLEITAHIVSAYVAKNRLPAADLGGLIASVASSIGGISQPSEPAAPPPVPAVNPRRSVTPDYIICLEDGKQLKMLKRHLKTAYNMSPDEYRERWGLAADYPMVAPNYAKQRSKLAKQIGLGTRARRD